MNKSNNMLFTFSIIDKQGEIKEVIDHINMLQIEELIEQLDVNLFNYNVHFQSDNIEKDKVKKLKN